MATYATREEFVARLRAACPQRTPVAVNYSATIPALSLVDHGLVALLTEHAIPVLAAETLIQRVLGVLSAAGRASHDRAAVLVRGVLAAGTGAPLPTVPSIRSGDVVVVRHASWAT